ncbi:glycosyltransferase family 4 protein [Aureibaculum sp. 2210JD6-5]|uniref:glycosyltransferase family 4 protein n=1 Tax=Aureibaculum sp. 2210JD6-5 TaxID=3103957 RepID=UPI002AAD1AC4|nr:glycosyltransferase family 4 protein [Aureibaculum sp. 2210JD6-5]MDY7394193.1 glycosyltransferase family 4 protein [Aureibaculum sp. 2210JD6-5]
MNILLIHQYFLEKNDGGGSRFNEMTQVWSEMGHKITVISGMVHYNSGKKYEHCKGRFIHKQNDFYPNVDVVRSHVSESYNVNFLGRLWGYFSFVFSSMYAGIFKAKGKYDVVIVTSPPLFIGITGYILSRLKRLPLVFEVRDLWPESAIDTGVISNKYIIKFAYWFEKFIYKKSKVINVLTPAFKQKLIESKGIPANKIIFIPNAADFSLAEAISKDFNAERFRKKLNLNDKFIITYVGAHGVANHLIQLIDVAEELQGTEIVFQLIGSGMQKPMLINEVAKRNLDNVIFVDPVPKKEVFKYILASDMGASVLKKVDTFKTIYSNKTFDYMSCKKPILLAIDGVSRALVKEADCGFYVEPENTKAIVEGVLMAIEHKDRLNDLGQNGYEFAKRHFDRNKLASDYLNQINEKLAK